MKYLLVCMALVLFGCEPVVVTVNVPKKTPKIVVDGVFNPESEWSLTLSLNQFILNATYGYDLIEDNEIKEVRISDENSTFILVESFLKDIDKNKYKRLYKRKEGQPKPAVNKTYKLEILTHSYGTVTASGIVPPVVPITSATIGPATTTTTTDASNNNKNKTTRTVTIEFVDDGNTTNFYEIYIFRPESKPTNDLFGLTIDNPAYSEQVTKYNTFLFDDTLFNGKPAKFSLKIDDSSNNNVGVVLRSVSADFYKFTTDKNRQEQNDDNPFSEPVLIQGNIQNGFGIFTGFSTSVYQTKN